MVIRFTGNIKAGNFPGCAVCATVAFHPSPVTSRSTREDEEESERKKSEFEGVVVVPLY